MNAACWLCGQGAPKRFTARGHAIHRCIPCDFEFVHPVPDAATIARVYDTEYFAASTANGYDDYFGRERAVLAEKARVRLGVLHGLGAHGGRWLDVGCADGFFVGEALAAGHEAFGVEHGSDVRARAVPAAVGRIHASLDEARDAGPFDVVTLWDVLEHLPTPLDTLATLRSMLAPGALVAVVLPVIDNVNARIAPRWWDQYRPPEHLGFFSRTALRTTLEKALGATTVHESSAWRRAGRITEVALPRAPAWLRALDRIAWRAVAPDALDDSWFIVVRTR